MRRPASLAGLAAAVLLAPVVAGAQRPVRRAFAPALTPFAGISAFGARTEGPAPGTAANDYTNSLVFGVQAERPLTRRTGLMGTLAVSPFTRVTAHTGSVIAEGPRARAIAVDGGIAGRFKPSAPVFGFVGAGGVMFSRPARIPDGANPEAGGAIVEPRATAGVGLDFLRREQDGFRVMWLGHLAVPRVAGDDRYTSNSAAFDWTLVIGGRLSLGRSDPEGDR